MEVISVVDTNEDLAKRVSKEFGIKTYHTDYKKALADEEVDIVSICTPSPTHAEIIISAAQAGKNILVEKPFTIDVEDGKKAVTAVKENGVQLCVIFNYRMIPAVQQVYKAIELEGIGRVVSMKGTAHTGFPTSWTGGRWLYHEGGALDDFGPHLIDLLLWLNPSKIEAVSAIGGDFTGNFGFISHIQVCMKFKDTSLAVADISWLTDSVTFSLDIQGTAGRISCDARNNSWRESHGRISSPLDDLKFESLKSLGVIKSLVTGAYFKGGIRYHSQFIGDYIQSIKTGNRPPITGEEALIVTAVSAAAKQSLKFNKVVFLEELL
jgi:predicted dehydrogenase